MSKPIVPRVEKNMPFKRGINARDLRNLTRYHAKNTGMRLITTITGKYGPVANVVGDDEGAKAILVLNRQNGDKIEIWREAIQPAFNREVPIRFCEKFFYDIDPMVVVENGERLEDGRVSFPFQSAKRSEVKS